MLEWCDDGVTVGGFTFFEMKSVFYERSKVYCPARGVSVMRSEFWMLTDPNQPPSWEIIYRLLPTHRVESMRTLTEWSIQHQHIVSQCEVIASFEGILISRLMTDPNRTPRSEIISHDLTIPWSKRELWLRSNREIIDVEMRTEHRFHSASRESSQIWWFHQVAREVIVLLEVNGGSAK